MMKQIMRVRAAIIGVLEKQGFTLLEIGKCINLSKREIGYIKRKAKQEKQDNGDSH